MNFPRLASLLPALLLSSLVACKSSVIGGGAGGAGGSGGADGAGGAQVISGGGATPSGGAGGQGGGSQPNAIVYGDTKVTFRISSVPLSCGAPEKDPPFADCDWYNVEIGMPASLVEVGTIDLGTDSEITMFISEASSPDGSGMCGGTAAISGGGMGGAFGLLDITAVSAKSVTFTLSGTSGFVADQNPDGTYTAPRCE